MEFIAEAFESTGFWLLGGVGTAMVILGQIIGKNMSGFGFPLWQLIIVIMAVWVAAAVFGRE